MEEYFFKLASWIYNTKVEPCLKPFDSDIFLNPKCP